MVLDHTPSRINSVYNLRSRNGGTGQGAIPKGSANKSLESSGGNQTFSPGKKQGPERITEPIPMEMPNSGQAVRVVGAFRAKQSQVLLNFSIEQNSYYFEFLVIPDSVYPIILGADFSRERSAKIYLQKGIVVIKFRDSWVEVPEIEVFHEYRHEDPINIAVISHKNVTYPSIKNQETCENVTDFESVVKNDRLSTAESRKFVELLNKHENIISYRPEPLIALTRKINKWRWTSVELESFEMIKEKLAEATLLYHPREDLPFCLQVDASDRGLGAQLFQMVGNERRVVAWASRLLMEREIRYHKNEKEALSIVWSTNRLRSLLLGRKFVIYTDNMTVTYLKTCRLLSARIARYALALQEIEFDLVHISSNKNFIADVLSRQAATRPPTPEDKLFQILHLSKFSPDFRKLLNDVKRYQDEDKKEKLSDDETLQKRFLIKEGILYTRNSNDELYLLCVPSALTEDFAREYPFGRIKPGASYEMRFQLSSMTRSISLQNVLG
ncbi:hypothetical protein JTB14_010144 [Gonioctena quinquepunctata]|nr:hypothetical protein JTB14_010144 [Gonioctena quinquepunctata]